MNVTFANFGDKLASSRYRALIPQRELKRLGVDQGREWLVIGKHGWDWRFTVGFEKVCFDVCDDHFEGEHRGHYLSCIEKADLVTCNSEEMARIIEAETGRRAIVIPDPYEQPQGEARVNANVLWFGHGSNLADLAPYSDIPNLEIVSNVKGMTQWTPDNMNAAFNRAGLVIIPTGKSMAKSANRAIESIRRGLFVVAGYLPSYADLGIYIGEIRDGVQWALSHQDEVVKRIKRSQEYVNTEYSPERIGKLWLEALSSI